MRRKKVLVYVCVSIISISLLSLLYTQGRTPAPLAAAQQKKSTLYPAQYSDTHITKNAIATDQRFKNLATFDKENYLASVANSLQTNPQTPEASQSEKGVWLWTPTLYLTPEYRDSVIAGAKKNGIRNIYLSIDSYLDIYVMPESPEKETLQKEFDRTLENFIAMAHENNMTVDAEAGWRNWAEPGNEYKAFAVVDYARQFNATHTEKLRGLQYDIEPYLLASYPTDKKTVLRNFVDIVNRTVTRLNNSDLRFSVVIPDFYDRESGETPRFLYGWRYSYTLTHLLNALERRPGSTLLVMAYRNQSEGTDGSIEISRDEIFAANNYHTKVIVAQETGDVAPPSITFYKTSLSSLNTQLRNIQEEFSNNKSYGGLAIHYINALLELE